MSENNLISNVYKLDEDGNIVHLGLYTQSKKEALICALEQNKEENFTTNSYGCSKYYKYIKETDRGYSFTDANGDVYCAY